MGSIARHQRREIARKWAMAGIPKEAAKECVNAIKDNKKAVREEAEVIARGALDKYRLKIKNNVYNDIIPRVQGDMICLFLYCLHSRWGFGQKRLKDAAADLWEVVGEMQKELVNGDTLSECIKEETGLNLPRVFAKLSNDARKENERARRKKAGL